MNYQHAYHAGNFADVHKHVVLTRILLHLRGKPAAFRVIDSHAGAGRYELLAVKGGQSGEWRTGIARVWDAVRNSSGGYPPPQAQGLLAPYLEAVSACNSNGSLRTYPGSPWITQHLLRPRDRLIACEIEPRSATSLAAVLRRDRRVKVLAINGWTALSAYVPPKERRGLVLVDPPFEDSGDFARLSASLATAYRKWPTGSYMLWYPIKERGAPDALARRLQRLPIAKALRCEIMIGPPRANAGLIGSGLILVNPPYTLEPDLRVLMPALAGMLAPQATQRVDWLAEERGAHFSTG